MMDEDAMLEREHATMDRFTELSHVDGVQHDTLRGEIIEDHMPMARALAGRYRGRGEQSEDLDQVAMVALVHAVDRFDVSFGTPFAGFAVPTIRGELRRHFRDRGWDVRVPRKVQENRLMVTQAIDDLSQRNGVEPSADAIAAHLGLDRADVVEAIRAGTAYQAEPLDHDDGAAAGRREAQVLGVEDGRLSTVELRESLIPLLRQLDEREQRILSLRFYGNKKQAEIADELGVSQMHVSRILSTTLQWLHDRIDGHTQESAPGVVSKRRSGDELSASEVMDLDQRTVRADELLGLR